MVAIVLTLPRVLTIASWSGHRALPNGRFFCCVLATTFCALVALVIDAEFLWTGTIGAMTFAVITRATWSRTVQAVAAGPATVAIYVFLRLATPVRVCTSFRPEALAPTRRAGRPIGLYGLRRGLWSGFASLPAQDMRTG